MSVRLFSKVDLEKCVFLFIDVFSKDPWNDRWSYEGARDYLSDIVETPGFIGVIAEKENNIVGFMFGHRKRWWKGHEYFIHEMCVDSNSQRVGIGTEIMNYLERLLPDKGISNIVLLTNRGIPAEKFYHKKDFREISRIVFLAKHIRQ